jgi:hypothetical protein
MWFFRDDKCPPGIDNHKDPWSEQKPWGVQSPHMPTWGTLNSIVKPFHVVLPSVLTGVSSVSSQETSPATVNSCELGVVQFKWIATARGSGGICERHKKFFKEKDCDVITGLPDKEEKYVQHYTSCTVFRFSDENTTPPPVEECLGSADEVYKNPTQKACDLQDSRMTFFAHPEKNETFGYKLLRKPKNWKQADRICKKRGLRLPLVRDEAQDKFLMSLFKKKSDSIEIDAQQQHWGYWLGNTKSEIERCEDDGKNLFANWHQGKPDSGKKRTQIEVVPGKENGQWIARRKMNRRFVFCECGPAVAESSEEMASFLTRERKFVGSLFHSRSAYSASPLTILQFVAAFIQLWW